MATAFPVINLYNAKYYEFITLHMADPAEILSLNVRTLDHWHCLSAYLRSKCSLCSQVEIQLFTLLLLLDNMLRLRSS